MRQSLMCLYLRLVNKTRQNGEDEYSNHGKWEERICPEVGHVLNETYKISTV